ncbi:MAG: leucine-rich repeat domain-containing protein [Bacteroidales bacterium]|nr:leucine-rich repeat domain-containing protein [Bacteroidales bacterium]
MKKILTLLWALAVVSTAHAFSFSKTLSSGQTLYFTITTGTAVKVVAPTATGWNGHTTPSGRLVIPSTVENEGTTYNVTAIDRMAFQYCYDLEAVTIPGSVVTIGQRAFVSDTSLTSLVIQEGVQRIDMMAFNSCIALDTIELPTTLTRIAMSVFENTGYYNNMANWNADSTLTIGPWLIKVGNQVTGTVHVHEGVLGIANNAFLYCRYMDRVSLPSTLHFVGEGAFKDCEELDTVQLLCEEPPAVSDDSFDGVQPLPVLVVPCSTATVYGSTEYWRSHTIVEDTCPIAINEAITSEPITVASVRGGVVVRGAEGRALTVCDMTGRRVCYVSNATGGQYLPLPAVGIYVLLPSEGGAVKISYCK